MASRTVRRSGTKSNWRLTKRGPYGVQANQNYKTKSNAEKQR